MEAVCLFVCVAMWESKGRPERVRAIASRTLLNEVRQLSHQDRTGLTVDTGTARGGATCSFRLTCMEMAKSCSFSWVNSHGRRDREYAWCPRAMWSGDKRGASGSAEDHEHAGWTCWTVEVESSGIFKCNVLSSLNSNRVEQTAPRRAACLVVQ